MTQRILAAAGCILWLFSGAVADASELQYVSDNEISLEIAERRADIARTEVRLAILAERIEASEAALQAAREENAQVEAWVAARARLYYRFSRPGETARYLLSAASPLDLLKRASFLRGFIVEALEARREAGLKIAREAERLSVLIEERDAAHEAHDMLTQTLGELLREAGRRSIRP